MTEITRADYEAGRVRRRDGGEFRVYAWPDETPSRSIVGLMLVPAGWEATQWHCNGARLKGEHEPFDLILAPRTVYVTVAQDAEGHVIAAADFDNDVHYPIDNYRAGFKILVDHRPIEIEE